MSTSAVRATNGSAMSARLQSSANTTPALTAPTTKSRTRWRESQAATPSPLARTYGTKAITAKTASRDNAPAITSPARPRAEDIDEMPRRRAREPRRLLSPRTNPGADLASPRAGARRPASNSPSAESASPSRWMAPVSRQSAATAAAAPRSGVVAAPTTSRPRPRPAPREPRSPESRRVPTWRRGFHPNWPPAGPSGRTPRLAGTGCSKLLQLECTASKTMSSERSA